MENTTKEKILDAALVSFAENGYKGTNLRDLAAGLGLSKSALYRHYESKEDIWNAVLDRMEAYYVARFGSPENTPPAPKSCDELLAMTMRMLDFTMHDQKVILTRRLLLTEQFRDERARRFATLHFLTGTKNIYAKIPAEMMDNGHLKKGQLLLVKALAETGIPTVQVSLRDPYDLCGSSACAARIEAWDYSRSALDCLVPVLRGQQELSGIMPVTLR